MLRITIKGLLARKVRLMTSALAVVLGVAFMAGTFVLTDTVTRTFDTLFASVYKGTDAVVRGQAEFTGPQNTGTQRARVDQSLVATVEKVPGVALAQGEIYGYTRLIAKDGRALGNPASGAPTLGSSWSDVPRLNPFTLVAGRAPTAPAEIAIDRQSARTGKLAVGDYATVLTKAPPQRMLITGIVRFGNADSPGGASVVLFTPPVAQQLVAEPGKYDSISVVADKGISQSQITARISKVLPAGTEAVTGAAVIRESQNDMHKAMSFFSTLMLVFAIVSLLVGAFIIFNTFSITVAQRTRENALFRALGASRGQVLSAVLLEALLIGIGASLVGLVAGVAVAIGLKGLLSAMGFGIPAGGIVFLGRTVLVSMLTGVGVTLVAALSPARKAGKVPPIAAMREIVVGSTGYGSKERVIVGGLLTSAGVTALLFGLFAHPANALLVVGAGALLVFFGVSALGRTVSLPLSRVIGAPLPRLRGASGLLARQNAMRNPKRTAASASALMIGVGLVAFITIFASSTKASINATVDRAFTGDFIIDSGAGMMGGLDPTLAQRLNQLPQVQAATGIKLGVAKIDGSVQMIIGVDPVRGFQMFDVKPLQGRPADLGADSIAVYKDVAKDKHLSVGDTVPVLFKDTGTKQMKVALIYGENRPAGNYVLSNAAYSANFANNYDSQIFIKKTPGASSASALAEVRQLAAQYPGAKVLDQTGYKAEMAKPINQQLSFVYVLLALAVLIALMGIANALGLSIFERTRELGLLRAVGMTRSQLRSTIRWESVIIALQGTLLGMLVGIFFGWALVKALSAQGIDQFALPVGSLAVIVAVGALAGVMAAVVPGRRAARLDVLKAVGAE
ncbi:MAG TPA: FtsX-like permease family protein [Acidimicrobiales bacterium]|nr:FtsX-like permease family protein [Acidimicrobiales bacterium]